jgi:glycine hydroxymethyltransferase
MLDLVATQDPEAAAIMTREAERQEYTLELIASENHVSAAVMHAAGSWLTNKYAEGYPGKRYYGGCEFHDQIEDLARERAKRLFGCAFANVQPHCGANANIAAFMALCDPGDRILSLPIKSGGHLSHGLKPNFSGTFYSIVDYDLDPKTELLDYDLIDRLAAEHKPKMIICGYSAYRAPSTSPASARSPTATVPTSWPTSLTSRGWSRRACIPRHSRMPMS